MVTSLLGEAAAAGFFTQTAHASMVTKLSVLNSCAGRVLTYLASQIPYTYVNLVSLVVHVYLLTLATWFGFMFSSGMNMLHIRGETEADVEPSTPRGDVIGGARYGPSNAASWSAREVGTSLRTDMLTVTFGYCFVGFSNVLFQGLLNMHALLDNPFGHHPAKFPLRAYVAQIIGTTNALAAGAHQPPASSAFKGLFDSVLPASREEGVKRE